MSTNMTKHLASKVLGAIFKNDPFSFESVYISLHDGYPTEDGLYELDYQGYERKELSPINWDEGVDEDQLLTNTEIAWENIPDGKTVTHIGIWDSLTDGNLLWISALISEVYIPDGNAFRLAEAKLVAEIDPEE